MVSVIKISASLAQFELPVAVQARLTFLLGKQDEGQDLSDAELAEAEGLVQLAEFLSLLQLRAQNINRSQPKLSTSPYSKSL